MNRSKMRQLERGLKESLSSKWDNRGPEAHRTLKELRRPGETYSDAILNNVRPPAETSDEILQRLKAFLGKNLVDPELMAIVRAGPGRGSPRKIRNAAPGDFDRVRGIRRIAY